MNRSGVIGIIFVGLFALLAGLVGGTIFGARAILKTDAAPIASQTRSGSIDTTDLDRSGRELSLSLIDQLSGDLRNCRKNCSASAR